MEFQELLNIKTDTPFELELEEEGTQTILEKVSEFLVIDSANIASTSASSNNYLLANNINNFNTNPPDSWVLSTGSNQEDFTFVCLWKNCFEYIPNSWNLENHLEEHFRNEFSVKNELSTEQLKCPIFGCEINLESSKHVYCHLRSHYFQAEKQKVGLEYYRKLFPSLIPCGFERTSYLPLEGDPWVCGWKDCKTVFDDLKQFVSHVSSHLNGYGDDERDESGMFPCCWISGIEHKQCEKRFSQKAFLKVHLKSHSGNRVCACPYCGTFLANTTKLCDHVHRRQPTSDAPLICALCQKKFSTNRLLKIHCRKHVKSVKCAICDVVMDCASAVAKHMKIVHAKIKNEKCPECNQTFGLKTDLQKHIAAIHQIEPQFACKFCDDRFRWEKQLRAHEKTHSKDFVATPYLCHKFLI
uniref:C2H2-type domain-containing protein n=1 Tax=Panagrolaimus superbus TaxID=310955 RepID=A0A914YAQ6_9BILA